MAAPVTTAAIPSSRNSTIKTLILHKVGYVEGAGFGGQSEKTEYSLFWMCTILPVITSIISIVPKLFYDLSGEKKDRMYAEMFERRAAIAREVESTDLAGEGEEKQA